MKRMQSVCIGPTVSRTDAFALGSLPSGPAFFLPFSILKTPFQGYESSELPPLSIHFRVAVNEFAPGRGLIVLGP
jgi:hypothetical protein